MQDGKIIECYLISEGLFTDQVHFARHIFSLLPKHEFNGKDIPRVITRIDIGCCLNGGMFLSEVEFVPSLYIADLQKKFNYFQPDVLVGNQMKQVIEVIEKHMNICKPNYLVINMFIILMILLIVLTISLFR